MSEFDGLSTPKQEGGSFCSDCQATAPAGVELQHRDGCDVPTLAARREQEAMVKAHAVFAAARELMLDGMLLAVGYRVLVKPLDVIQTLEVAQAEEFPTLAERDFEAKSHAQKKREERGENHGVLINMGKMAFDRLGGRDNWCGVGDVVVFSRYAGTQVEYPPGSGILYQIMNDEDVFGRVE